MKNNQTKDYDDDISFNVINQEYNKYIPSQIEVLRDTNKFNNEDKEILKSIQDKKEQEEKNEQNNFDELNNIENINHLHLMSTQAFLEALNHDTLRYALQTQDIQSNKHHSWRFISILFLCGLTVWLTITGPTLPPAAVQIGKYYVFSPEYPKIKMPNKKK